MLGRVLLTLDSAALLLGAWIADYHSETHIFNPRWPPHAKFHTGQTITLSTILGAATLYLTWRSSSSSTSSREMRRAALQAAAFTGSIYWVAGLAAILFPHTDGLDPEFGGPGFPQKWAFVGCTVLALAGAFLESL